MTKLLRACIRRYTHTAIFWVATVLTLGIGISIAHSARMTYYDDAMVITQMVIHAIMVSWVVGKEFREGIFRNKVIIGHSKRDIFLVELLSGVGISFVLYFLCATLFLVFNAYEIPLLPTSLIVNIFVDYILLNICLSAIFVTISCLFSHQATIAIVNIVCVLLMVVGSQRLYADLSQPQHYEYYETVNSEWIDENGNIRYKQEKIEGSEYFVDNPTYIGGIKRDIYETVYYFSPYGHIIEFVHFNMDWHGYDYVRDVLATDIGMTGEDAWEMIISDNVITEETLAKFTANVRYSCVLLVATSAVGYLCFRRKELK